MFKFLILSSYNHTYTFWAIVYLSTHLHLQHHAVPTPTSICVCLFRGDSFNKSLMCPEAYSRFIIIESLNRASMKVKVKGSHHTHPPQSLFFCDTCPGLLCGRPDSRWQLPCHRTRPPAAVPPTHKGEAPRSAPVEGRGYAIVCIRRREHAIKQ